MSELITLLRFHLLSFFLEFSYALVPTDNYLLQLPESRCLIRGYVMSWM